MGSGYFLHVLILYGQGQGNGILEEVQTINEHINVLLKHLGFAISPVPFISPVSPLGHLRKEVPFFLIPFITKGIYLPLIHRGQPDAWTDVALMQIVADLYLIVVHVLGVDSTCKIKSFGYLRPLHLASPTAAIEIGCQIGTPRVRS